MSSLTPLDELSNGNAADMTPNGQAALDYDGAPAVAARLRTETVMPVKGIAESWDMVAPG